VSEAEIVLERTIARSVSVVIPVYRSTTSLIPLVNRLEEALVGCEFEIILVDDGSPAATWEIAADLAKTHASVRAIRLGRNFGQHNALIAGIHSARHAVIVTMDDDLQNPPEEVPRLLAALGPSVDVVYGVSSNVAQTAWRRFGSSLARRIISRLGAVNVTQMSSFRVIRRDLRESFPEDLGPSVSLDAMLSWVTERFETIEVEHVDRQDGKSNYSASRLVRFALDVTTGYSAVPLQIALTLGLATAAFGVAVLAYVLIRFAVSGTSVAGFPFLASIIAIFSGVQLLTLGVIGEYLARMHFRIMRKPTYVIAEIVPPRNEISDSP
jgi:glycosyltransferase involved in cell wall biosynthesis